MVHTITVRWGIAVDRLQQAGCSSRTRGTAPSPSSTQDSQAGQGLRVGGHGPFGVEIDRAAGLAYVTGTRGGNMAVLDTTSLEVVERITFAGPARDVIQNPVVHEQADSIYIISGPDKVGVIARR